MTGRIAVGLLAMVLFIAAPSLARGQGSIVVGQTVNGRLVGVEATLADGSFYDDWTFDGVVGQTVTIVMRSGDFDAYLHLGRMVGGGFESLATDDDGAGGTDARIVHTLPATGRYVIRANTLYNDERGAYTLSLSSDYAPEEAESGATRSYLNPIFDELLSFRERLGEGETVALTMLRAAPGETHVALRLAVTPGRSYTVRGACDRDCLDLDLSVVDGAGNEVGADRAVDDYPTVTFTARNTGQYVISATMAQCGAPYCYYGVLALGR